MNKFAERKKLLAAESEVYRQLLKLELQTFKVYGLRTRRRLTSVGTYLPFVMSSFPVIRDFFRIKKKGGSPLKRMGSLLFMGWNAYKRFAPLFARGGSLRGKEEPGATAAEEYLSKRL